jgi:hypothetical protein
MNSVFTKKDYNSNDGMLTYVWGPPLWHTLHIISFNYPIEPTDEQKKQYYNFFSNLKNILPCKYCRDNLKKNLKTHKLTLSVFKNRDSLSKWVYELHEIVNEMLGKKSGLSYKDVRNRYEIFRSRCLLDPNDTNTKDKGCTEPLYGLKSKCILNIVPKEEKSETFNIDSRCIIKKKK